MLDLETLSTRPDATILTFGACKFNPYAQEEITQGIYFRINVDEQITLGRHVDDNTIEWWGKQAEDVYAEAFDPNDRISLEQFTQELNRFIVGVDNIWAQGPVFDIAILENIYRQYGWPTPWPFWQISDSRTLFKTHGDPRKKDELLHNALADCVSQAEAVQQIYNKLGLEKR